MDGIVPLEDVIVIAATNRPDIVDPAALRAGRFDRLIYVPEPGEAARLEIFKIHTRRMPLSKDVDMEEHHIAKGCSSADIIRMRRGRHERFEKGHQRKRGLIDRPGPPR